MTKDVWPWDSRTHALTVMQLLQCGVCRREVQGVGVVCCPLISTSLSLLVCVFWRRGEARGRVGGGERRDEGGGKSEVGKWEEFGREKYWRKQ